MKIEKKIFKALIFQLNKHIILNIIVKSI